MTIAITMGALVVGTFGGSWLAMTWIERDDFAAK